jgi:uncharacterized membrane protein
MEQSSNPLLVCILNASLFVNAYTEQVAANTDNTQIFKKFNRFLDICFYIIYLVVMTMDSGKLIWSSKINFRHCLLSG